MMSKKTCPYCGASGFKKLYLHIAISHRDKFWQYKQKLKRGEV